jgi:hypothetical protein
MKRYLPQILLVAAALLKRFLAIASVMCISLCFRGLGVMSLKRASHPIFNFSSIRQNIEVNHLAP